MKTALPTRFVTVAIDGGAASGKSTTARTVADRLHLLHVDTGAHYRAVTFAARRAALAAAEGPALDAFLAAHPLATEVSGQRALVRLAGYLPHETELRADETNAWVSHFAALPAVRAHLFAYQRGLAEVARARGFAGLVMEGRDIGTVILPAADHKFFLVADPEVRAARRARDGQRDAVAQRDRLDAGRANAPLACAPDAIVIDTAVFSREEVAGLVLGVILCQLRPCPTTTAT